MCIRDSNTSDQLFDFFSSICAKHPAYARWEINISHINPKAYHYMFYDTFIARKDDKYNKQTKPTRPTTPTKQSRPTTLQGVNLQSLYDTAIQLVSISSFISTRFQISKKSNEQNQQINNANEDNNANCVINLQWIRCFKAGNYWDSRYQWSNWPGGMNGATE